MSIKNIKFNGTGEIETNEIVCICAHCNNHDRTMATIEFNFREQKIFYLCGQCKKMNEISFGANKPTPYPKMRIGR